MHTYSIWELGAVISIQRFDIAISAQAELDVTQPGSWRRGAWVVLFLVHVAVQLYGEFQSSRTPDLVRGVPSQQDRES